MSGLISFRNWVDMDSTILTPTYDVLTRTVDPAFPISNLKKRQLNSVCRELNGGTFYITMDFGMSRRLNLVAILALVMLRSQPESTTNGWSVTIQGSLNASFTPLVINSTFSSLLWPTVGAPANIYLPFPAETFVRYLRMQINWTQPTGQAFKDIGRIWAGDAIILNDRFYAGIRADWSDGFIDPGRLAESEGGQWSAARKPIASTLNLNIMGNSFLAYGIDNSSGTYTGKATLAALKQEAGTTGDVIAIPRSDTFLWSQATGLYGHVAQPFTISHVSDDNFTTNIAFRGER